MRTEPAESPRSAYVFDRDHRSERRRLEAQALLIDAGTIRRLRGLGPLDGLRCAEVGAGAGSIAVWLAEQVGPAGRVVATDVDTRFLIGLERPGLEIRTHDILAGSLEEASYDLVHTRLLLRHLPDCEHALRHMVASLRPGGWLLAEDFDLDTAGSFHPSSALQTRVHHAVQRLLETAGVDTRYGIKLVAALEAAGLDDVEAEAHLRVVRSGTPPAEALALKLEQFRDALVRAGQVTEEEVNRAIAEARDPDHGAVHYPPLMVAAWGRRHYGV
jgi:2-polyprenyl-3-methyl-5-hydroxy-6-metoxy-1,4-benzoquinol methylase